MNDEARETIEAVTDCEDFDKAWTGGLRERTITNAITVRVADCDTEKVQAALEQVARMGWLESARMLRRKLRG
ncbi:hypothetical protein LCGC14_0273020 [marine sediment metagenome]|uniref:Uncharacterized protein n=2 Tax=root TaxID=1 RepID=A0A9C9NEE7_9HYPH|nr:hypothetical protein [Aurantimonas coralicida]